MMFDATINSDYGREALRNSYPGISRPEETGGLVYWRSANCGRCHITVVMRVAIGLLVFSLSGRSLVSADEGELRKLEGAKRIFELRRALEQATGDGQDTRF